MLTLGIESTCDETSCSVVVDGKKILSNVVASQIDLHAEYGGVVPELSCRRHVDIMLPVISQALSEAKITLQDIDLIAVAYGPGLIGALLIGLSAAKGLALALDKPLIEVNHVEAHLYAALMSTNQEAQFPCLGVILSGGHTALVIVHSVDQFSLIGQTVDDAIGEAFDKTARLMHLPYPGGPKIEQLAQQGNPEKYSFKAGIVKGEPLNFSFSGLKTAVLYCLQENRDESHFCDIAASFQRAAFTDIIKKTRLAAEQYGLRDVLFGGGVTNNQALRKAFTESAPHLNLFWPTFELSLDNAAMIAGLGYHRYRRRGSSAPLDLEAMARIPFFRNQSTPMPYTISKK